MNKKTIRIGKYETTPKKLLFLTLHLLIIIAFTVQIIYSIVAFSVVASGNGIAGLEAATIPIDEMIRRRLYAIELWVSAAGLAVYLGIVYRNNLVTFFAESDDVKK